MQQQRQPRLIFLYRDRRLIGGGVHALQVGEQHPLPVHALNHMGNGNGVFVAIEVCCGRQRLRQQPNGRR